MPESPNQTIVNSYARRFTVEQLDEAIGQLSEAILTSSFQSLNVLGMSVSQDGARSDLLLETLELSRQQRLESDPATGAATADIALDAKSPLSHAFDFSLTYIE